MMSKLIVVIFMVMILILGCYKNEDKKSEVIDQENSLYLSLEEIDSFYKEISGILSNNNIKYNVNVVKEQSEWKNEYDIREIENLPGEKVKILDGSIVFTTNGKVLTYDDNESTEPSKYIKYRIIEYFESDNIIIMSCQGWEWNWIKVIKLDEGLEYDLKADVLFQIEKQKYLGFRIGGVMVPTELLVQRFDKNDLVEEKNTELSIAIDKVSLYEGTIFIMPAWVK